MSKLNCVLLAFATVALEVSCENLTGPRVDLTLVLSAERPLADSAITLADVNGLRPGDVLNAEVLIRNLDDAVLTVRAFKVHVLRIVRSEGGTVKIWPDTIETVNFRSPRELSAGDSTVVHWSLRIPTEFGLNPGVYTISVMFFDLGRLVSTTFEVAGMGSAEAVAAAQEARFHLRSAGAQGAAGDEAADARGWMDSISPIHWPSWSSSRFVAAA